MLVRRLLLVALLPVAVASTSLPASALLSPLWQSAAEMKAILSSNEVGDALKSQDPITSVTRTGDDQYEVSNGTCSVPVTIVGDATAPEMAGPKKFSIKVGTATCK
ncbi:MAG: hypothetical protein ABI399_08290 [Bauldia sp.]